jgi:hypothetical protein
VKLLRLIVAVAGFGALSTGCYTLQPMAVASPEPGTRLSFAINDVGRVALGGSMGPELLRVNGSLNSKEGDDYFVNVSGVDLLHGGFQSWAGETVRINSTYVSAVSERKFSKGRTIMASAVAVGVIAIFVNRGGFRAFITDDDPPPPPPLEERRGRVRLPGQPEVPPSLRSINPPRSY